MHRYRGRHLARKIRRTFTPARAWALTVCFVLITSGVSWADILPVTDAVDDSATVATNSGAYAIEVLANDTVIEGGTLAITEATQGANGAVTVTNGGADLTYEPSLDFCGPDSFTYTISDGLLGSDIATVTVDVTCELPPDETTTTTLPADETTTTTTPPIDETTTTTTLPADETTTTTTVPADETTTTTTPTTTTTVPAPPVLDLSTASTLIVKLVAGLSPEQQAAVILSHGGNETAAIDVLRLHMVAVAPETVEDSIAAFAADPAVVSVDLDLPRTAEAVPNDPGYADQWALPLIGWEDIYGVVTPLGSSTIAVLDTGVDAGTPDLAGRVVGGWSFDGTDPAIDASGHGTHVATIAAANDDNGVGIAGVAYSGVTIMPVRVLGDDGTGNDSDIITGLVWAVENGADVAVMAFSNPGESSALQFAVDYAWANGVVLVAAAGNDGGSAPTYPAGLAKVVGVGATDQADEVWSGSNQSAAVFMVAPGVGIASSTGTVTGTSASAAVVAGAAALLQAHDPSAHPSIIVGRLARNTDPAVGNSGNGRLNLARSIVDESIVGVTPAGAPGGGPIVGPYVAAAGINVDIAPDWVSAGTRTFSTLVHNSNVQLRRIEIVLPANYMNISVVGQDFSTGSWNVAAVNQIARRVTVTTTTTTDAGIAATNGWARIDIQADTPSTSSANWQFDGWTNSAGTGNSPVDLPSIVLVAVNRPDDAKTRFVNLVSGTETTPVLNPGTPAILKLRITQTAGSTNAMKYMSIALPTCFSTPTVVTESANGSAPAGYTITVKDRFILLSGSSVPGDSGFLDVTFTTTPGADCGGVLSFLVTVGTNQTNPPSGANQVVEVNDAGANVAVGVADLSITKTDSPDPVLVSSAVQYTLSVANAGPAAATAISVSDPLPAGTTFLNTTGTGAGWSCAYVLLSHTVTCTRPSLPPGTTAPDIKINVTSPAATGTISNTATVSSPHDNTPANNSDTETTTIVNQADLSVTKTDGVSIVTAGDGVTYTYTITVSNAGPANATGVTLSDTWPTGFARGTVTPPSGATCDTTTSTTNFTCNLGTINAGANKVVTATYTVPASTTASPQTNSVTVGSALSDPDTTNNTATDSNTVTTSADLSVTKADGETEVTAGDGVTYTYTIVVTNGGPSTATGVSLSDDWPASGFTRGTVTTSQGSCDTTTSLTDFTCTLGTLAPNALATITATYTVPSDATAGDRTNTAEVTSTSPDPDTDNNTASDTTTVIGRADLSITKADSPEPVFAGNNVTYTITVTNESTASTGTTATGITVTDTLPANTSFVSVTEGDFDCTETAGSIECTLASLGVGESASMTYVVKVDPTFTGPSISNTASVTSDTFDPVTTNDSDTETTAVEVEADLSVTKADGETEVTAGDGVTYTYTIVVTNGGPSTATGVSLSDDWPASGFTRGTVTTSQGSCDTTTSLTDFTCTLGTLAPNASATITATYTVPSDATAGDRTNTAEVTSTSPDPDTDNNTASDTTTIVRVADLEVAKADEWTGNDFDPVVAGEGGKYLLTVTNHGPSSSSGFTVTDTLPSGFTYDDANSDPNCDPGLAPQTVVCTRTADLADGGTVSYVIAYDADSTIPHGTVKTDTVTVEGDDTDNNPANNNATETTTVNREADLEVTKADEWTGNDFDPVIAGESGKYQLTVTNHGPSSSSGFTVTDTLPTGFTYDDAASDPACAPGTLNTVTCTRTADLADGASVSYVIVYDADSTIPHGTVKTDTVTVEGDDTDPDDTNNTATEITTVNREADLGITKTDAPDPVFSGDNITYTIVVTNHGPSSSSGFTVTDTLDVNVKFVSASAGCTHSGAASDGFGGTVMCVRTSDLAVNGSVTYTIVVQTRFPIGPDTVITNSATVDGDDTDPNATNDTATATTAVGLRPVGGSSTVTNSSFQIQTDLSPWTITDFEILVNNQNTIVATNPGQFYYHQRVFNTNTGDATASVDFELHWSEYFAPQTVGGQPLHAYVRLAGQTTWTDWSAQTTNKCWSQNQNTCANGADASITVNDVPANAEVWVTAHLDLKCKGQPYSCLAPNDPLKRPATYTFSSTATVKVSNVPVSFSTTSTSIIGRGKKVTMTYGTLTDKTTGLPLAEVWVRVSQGAKYATALTGTDGFYIFYDGQICDQSDGVAGGCFNGPTSLTSWSFANGSAATTIRILGTDPFPSAPPAAGAAAAYPTGKTTAEVKVGTTWTAKNPPSYEFTVAKGTAYSRDWRFGN